MIMQMLGCFAEFERAMVRERTRAGLKAAREQGRKGGRGSKLLAHQRAEILAMLAAGHAGAEIARLFRVHPQRSAASLPRPEPYPLQQSVSPDFPLLAKPE